MLIRSHRAAQVVLKISQGSHEAQARLVQVDVMPVQQDTADDL